MIQAAKARARGYRTTRNLATMAYIIGGKLSRLPASPYNTTSGVAACAALPTQIAKGPTSKSEMKFEKLKRLKARIPLLRIKYIGQEKLLNTPFYHHVSTIKNNKIILPDRTDVRTSVNLRYRYLYCALPKVANTSVHIALANCEGIAPGNELKKMTKEERHRYGNSLKKRGTRPSELGYWRNRSVQNSYFKFAFVRNPYARLASAYLDKIVRKKIPDVHLHLGKNKNDDVDFFEFVRYLEEGGLYTRDYWCPQTVLLPYRPGQFDFVGRFESFEEDLNSLCLQLFETTPYTKKPSFQSTKSELLLERIYDDKLMEKVNWLYAEDFEGLPYEKKVLPKINQRKKNEIY